LPCLTQAPLALTFNQTLTNNGHPCGSRRAVFAALARPVCPEPVEGLPYFIDDRVRRDLLPGMATTLRIKITAKRQATFPAAALRALQAKPGDYLALIEDRGTWRLESAAVDHGKLAPLRARVAGNRTGAFDLTGWREKAKNHALLRD
jgi:hypothetical protein